MKHKNKPLSQKHRRRRFWLYVVLGILAVVAMVQWVQLLLSLVDIRKLVS